MAHKRNPARGCDAAGLGNVTSLGGCDFRAFSAPHLKLQRAFLAAKATPHRDWPSEAANAISGLDTLQIHVADAITHNPNVVGVGDSLFGDRSTSQTFRWTDLETGHE